MNNQIITNTINYYKNTIPLLPSSFKKCNTLKEFNHYFITKYKGEKEDFKYGLAPFAFKEWSKHNTTYIINNTLVSILYNQSKNIPKDKKYILNIFRNLPQTPTAISFNDFSYIILPFENEGQKYIYIKITQEPQNNNYKIIDTFCILKLNDIETKDSLSQQVVNSLLKLNQKQDLIIYITNQLNILFQAILYIQCHNADFIKEQISNILKSKKNIAVEHLNIIKCGFKIEKLIKSNYTKLKITGYYHTYKIGNKQNPKIILKWILPKNKKSNIKQGE